MISYIEIYRVEQYDSNNKYLIISVRDIIKNDMEKFTVKKNDTIHNYILKSSNSKYGAYGSKCINIVVSVDYGVYGNNLQVATPLEVEKFSLKYGEYLI